LHVLAYNLTRVMNIIGVHPLLVAMRAESPSFAFSYSLQTPNRADPLRMLREGRSASSVRNDEKRPHSSKSRSVRPFPARFHTTKVESECGAVAVG